MDFCSYCCVVSGLWNILWFIQALCAAMRGCVWLFALALVVGHGLCTDPAQTRRDSFDIRSKYSGAGRTHSSVAILDPLLETNAIPY